MNMKKEGFFESMHKALIYVYVFVTVYLHIGVLGKRKRNFPHSYAVGQRDAGNKKSSRNNDCDNKKGE